MYLTDALGIVGEKAAEVHIQNLGWVCLSGDPCYISEILADGCYTVTKILADRGTVVFYAMKERCDENKLAL